MPIVFSELKLYLPFWRAQQKGKPNTKGRRNAEKVCVYDGKGEEGRPASALHLRHRFTRTETISVSHSPRPTFALALVCNHLLPTGRSEHAAKQT